jgi:hypothetical protein
MAAEPEFANRRPMAMPVRTDFQAPVSRPAPVVSRPAPAVAPVRPAPSGRAAPKVEIP